MARIMTAKRADTCRDPKCSKPIAAGEQINYGGPGAVTHEACEPMDAPSRGRSRRRTGGHYAYTSNGALVTSRSSRCEDAPCCGCCS